MRKCTQLVRHCLATGVDANVIERHSALNDLGELLHSILTASEPYT